MPKQDVAVELFYDGSWHDIAGEDDVYAESPIVIQRGQGDESPAPRPAQVSMMLANDDDRYRTSNPVSPLYGKAGRNTPARVSVGGSVRVVVEASSLSCDQTPDFRVSPPRGKAWAEFEGGGLLQRIGQWTEPLKSPFRQYNEDIAAGSSAVVGYWHAEQAAGSPTLDSTVPGTLKPRDTDRSNFFGFSFDSQNRPPGSGPLMDVGKGAEVGLTFAGAGNPDSTAGWQFSWAAQYGPFPNEETDLVYIDGPYAGGIALSFGVSIDPSDNGIYLSAYRLTPTGSTTLAHSGTLYEGYDWSQWTLFSLDAQYSGGSTTLYLSWTNADNTQSGFASSAAFAGPPGTLDWWSMVEGGTDVPEGSTIGHFMGANVSSLGGVNLYSGARVQAWTGYLGERAAYRFGRLCEQLGVSYFVSSPGYLTSMPMGPQPVASFPEQLEEIATTENALLYDYRTEARIFLLCRADRYHRTPVVELVPADLPALPREVADDLPVHNIVTVVQRDGPDATARDDTGPLGTSPPPDGAGEYRQRVDVNVADPDNMLPILADWWLGHGTVELPRFPRIRIDLAALSPARVAEIEALDVGDVLTIVGFREYTVRLYVLGYTEIIGTHSREITFVCAPDQQFTAALYDDAGARYDSATTTIKSAATSTGTALVLRTTRADEVWSSAETPYGVMVYGERVTATAVGAASLVSGAYDQAATVTRSANGVVKSIAAGRPARVADQARYAL